MYLSMYSFIQQMFVEYLLWASPQESEQADTILELIGFHASRGDRKLTTNHKQKSVVSNHSKFWEEEGNVSVMEEGDGEDLQEEVTFELQR